MNTEAKIDYLDLIDMDKKNQTAKVLERYFYSAINRLEYKSVVADEEEIYDRLPTKIEFRENMTRIGGYVNEILLRSGEYEGAEINDELLQKYVYELNPFVDKLIALIIANNFDYKDKFESKVELNDIWKKSIDEIFALIKENIISKLPIDSNEIDTSGLSTGMVIRKGYKELCKILKEAPLKSGSNSYKAQLKRWARYFKMEKGRGRSLVILDIYDEPLPVEDKRKAGNRNIYLKYIETILLKYIYFRKGQECCATRNQLWNILGMINSDYKKIPLQVLQGDIEYVGVTKWELDNFYMRCNSRLNLILFSALNNLSNRSLINYQVQTMIVVPNTSKKGMPYKHYVANDDEIRRILAVERNVLNQMGLESKNHAACTMRLNEFYNLVNEKIHELYGWERKYERIKIIFNTLDIQEAITKSEYELHMLYLNELVIDAMDKNAEIVSANRMKKALIEYDEYIKKWKKVREEEPPELEEMDDIFTYPKYYVDIQRKLSQKFLSIQPKHHNSLQNDKELDELFANLGQE